MYPFGVSDLENFHLNLLGRDAAKTPERYRLTDRQRSLYAAATKEGVRGVFLPSTEVRDVEIFVATFVMGFKMTPRGDTLIAYPRPLDAWVDDQIKEIARHIFASRKNAKRKAIQVLYESFQKLAKTTRILQQPEPARWVAFGFTEDATLPSWMKPKVRSL